LPKPINIHTSTGPGELDTVAISMLVEGVQGDHIELDEMIGVDVIPVKPNVVPSSSTAETHQ